MRLLLFSLNALMIYALSDSPALGRTCTTALDHLDPSTRKFLNDCDDKTFCSAPLNGTCQTRVCRRDAFAFGYEPGEEMPLLCPPGSFCPDEGSGCKAPVEVGEACQFNRDEQCAPSADLEVTRGLADVNNNNGKICLKSTCMYANATLGQSCIYEMTGYTTTEPGGQEFINVVVRDNCRTAQFFCNINTNVCEPLRDVAQQCQYHRDCRSYNCVNNVCEISPNSPLVLATWQYAVTGISIIAGELFRPRVREYSVNSLSFIRNDFVAAIATTCVMLTFMHKRHRLESYKETRDYCYEQITLAVNVGQIVSCHAQWMSNREKHFPFCDIYSTSSACSVPHSSQHTPMVHAFRKQPLRAIYLIYELITTVLFRIPFWILSNIPKSHRSRPSWSLSRIVGVKLLRRLTLMTTRIDHIQKFGDHLTVTEGIDVKHVWVDPVPHLLTKQMAAWASTARVEPISIPGYWMDKTDTDTYIGAAPQPGEKVVYVLHGGGYIRLSASPKDPIANIARGLLEHCAPVHRVFAIEYRLSMAHPDPPCNPFPAALVDALAGYIVSGDSAGGNLAIDLVRYLVESAGWTSTVNTKEGSEGVTVSMPPPPGGVLLFSPWADMSGSDVVPGGSPNKHYDSDYLLPYDHPAAQYVRVAFLGPLHTPESLKNRYISPACDDLDTEESSFKGWPRTLVVAGGAEMFTDQIRKLVRKMGKDMGEGNGEGQVLYHEAPDGAHDFVGLFFHEPERTLAYKVVAKWLSNTPDMAPGVLRLRTACCSIVIPIRIALCIPLLIVTVDGYGAYTPSPHTFTNSTAVPSIPSFTNSTPLADASPDALDGIFPSARLFPVTSDAAVGGFPGRSLVLIFCGLSILMSVLSIIVAWGHARRRAGSGECVERAHAGRMGRRGEGAADGGRHRAEEAHVESVRRHSDAVDSGCTRDHGVRQGGLGEKQDQGRLVRGGDGARVDSRVRAVLGFLSSLFLWLDFHPLVRPPRGMTSRVGGLVRRTLQNAGPQRCVSIAARLGLRCEDEAWRPGNMPQSSRVSDDDFEPAVCG
ncbi:hypothetical protein EW146_g8029 [Bondarzewia mesenterica]|uniref:Alpha/beta hydrolase fold-3 domain-containing protein n=1 Tax=Bondarzewia mesenterica TaxID=1095465 RepID=A0A4S4LJC6_9AGAM|nr:hypothetical protein EW146_g8029 [Bondarzewia mesenterica]